MPTPFWTAAREQMLLDPTVTNLNTGSFGPLSRPVFERVTELRRGLAAEPMNFLLRTAPPLLWAARERLAEFLHADPARLIFTANVTAAVNLIASSLVLPAPGEVLLTDHEYGAMHWCWERAAQRQGLTLRTFPLPVMASSPEEIVAAAAAAMTDRTRLFFFSHVLSPTGMVLPARDLCAAARQRGIMTVVDGAHAPVFMPLNLDDVNADYYGANCHKWLLAPTGSGFLYCGRDMAERLQPLQVSWGWRRDCARLDARDDCGSTPRIRFLEFEGTRDPSAWIAVSEAIAFQENIGFDRIRERIGELTRHVRRRLAELPALTLATPDHPALHGAMTAFKLPASTNPAALRRGLWEPYRIEAPVVERSDRLSPIWMKRSPQVRPESYLDWKHLIRVSTHFYNTEDEVDNLATALGELLCKA